MIPVKGHEKVGQEVVAKLLIAKRQIRQEIRKVILGAISRTPRFH